jgi:hypothetical protein
MIQKYKRFKNKTVMHLVIFKNLFRIRKFSIIFL